MPMHKMHTDKEMKGMMKEKMGGKMPMKQPKGMPMKGGKKGK